MDDTDRRHLTRCVDLAEAALATDNDPFGSVLVSASGAILYEDHNRTAGGDDTRRWLPPTGCTLSGYAR